MWFILKRVKRTLVAGLLVLAPIYLAILLLLKAMRSLGTVVGPLEKLLPGWLPGAQVLSLFLVLVLCFLTGLALRTRLGRVTWQQIEKRLFQNIPGYSLLRSLTQRLAGETEGRAWILAAKLRRLGPPELRGLPTFSPPSPGTGWRM